MSREIMITSLDRERLIKLIKQAREFGRANDKGYLNDLENELNCAKIMDSVLIPPGTITMNSTVLLRDIDTEQEKSYTLVYPENANRIENKISVLAPIGTALLGFTEGDVVAWKVPAGKVRLKVEKIIYQPEAAGDYDL